MDKGGAIVGKGQVLGVRVHEADADRVLLSVVHLHRKRNGLHVHGTHDLTSVEELARIFGTRIPIVLAIDTDRCVHRVVMQATGAEAAIQMAFPNAPLGELIISVRSLTARTAVSMARATLVHSLVERFEHAGLRVVRTSIGPWALLSLRTLLMQEDGTWSIGGHAFRFEDTLLQAHTLSTVADDGSFDPGGEQVPRRHALAFAQAWDHLVGAPDQQDQDTPAVMRARREERARYLYEIGLVASLLILLGLLGGEQLVARRLDRIQQDLRTSATEHAREMEVMDALQAQVDGAERVRQAFGPARRRSLAWQAAHLVRAVPNGIDLERLAMDPLLLPAKEREPLRVRSGSTTISGRCTDSALLEQWMDALRAQPNVRSVRLLSYAMDARSGSSHFQLELER